jgi:hypothetical protein
MPTKGPRRAIAAVIRAFKPAGVSSGESNRKLKFVITGSCLVLALFGIAAAEPHLTRTFLASAGFWLLGGNAGTNPSTDFLGTTDDTSLFIKTNGSEVVRVGRNRNVGIGLSSPATIDPAHRLHLADGHLFLESGPPNPSTIIMKLHDTFVGPSGTSERPIFLFGRILAGGDGDPEFRFSYEDDFTAERPVLEFDRKGIVASVKPDRGSHFEGFISGHVQPFFRLNSFPKMRLEMGDGGSTPVDVAIQREAANTLTLLTGNAERVRIDSLGRVGIGTNKPGFALDVAGVVRASGFVGPSDARLKTNVGRLFHVLEKLEKVRGVSFDWKAVSREAPDRRQIGVIAQELETVFPELVTRSADGYRAVDYGRLTAVLLEGIKEVRGESAARMNSLQDQAAAQRQQITALQKENRSLSRRIAAVEKAVRLHP